MGKMGGGTGTKSVGKRDLEGLSLECVLKRIEVTQNQIDLVEEVLSNASKQRESMPPKLYDAMIIGYQGELKKLREEKQAYQADLQRK